MDPTQTPTPTHRPGALRDAGEIADVVAFLAGDGGRYITGTTVAVDGGFAA